MATVAGANVRASAAFNSVGNAVDRADETQLLQRARTGEREAFGQLVLLYWPRIFRWLYSCTGLSAVAEDLTQDVFLRAWANLSALESQANNLRAWLFRIAANLLVDWRRRRRAQQRLAKAHHPEHHSWEPPADVASREMCLRLWQAVDTLPLEYRMVLLLRVQEQLSFRQIGEMLGITEETARWRVFRARAMLLRRLGPLLDETWSDGNVAPMRVHGSQQDPLGEKPT